VPAADPTPVADPAPVAADPPAADPPGTTADASASAPGSPTDAASGAEPVPTVITASNAAQGTPEHSARTAAAKAFHILGHIADACREVQAELQKHVPPEVLAAAESEALVLFRSLL
jgi:hypothetical protein